MVPRDSTEEATQVQLKAQRALGAGGRLEAAMDMSDMVRALATAGYRARNPGLPDSDAKSTLVRHLYRITTNQGL